MWVWRSVRLIGSERSNLFLRGFSFIGLVQVRFGHISWGGFGSIGSVRSNFFGGGGVGSIRFSSMGLVWSSFPCMLRMGSSTNRRMRLAFQFICQVHSRWPSP